MNERSIDRRGRRCKVPALIFIPGIYSEIAAVLTLLRLPFSEVPMDDEDADYKVGYKKPPLHSRIKKGECRNPFGRRGKARKKLNPPISDAEILERIDNETFEYQGRMITKREAELRTLQARSLRGDPRATRLLDDARKKRSGKNTASRTGVLLLPSPVPLEEWEVSAAIQQAPYRQKSDCDGDATKSRDEEPQ